MAKKPGIIEFDELFKIPLTTLSLNGSYPYIPRNKTWLLRFLIMHGTFTAVFSIMVYNIFLSIMLEDYTEACRHGTVGIVYCVISFQFFVLLKHQKTIVQIIDMMKADFAEDLPQDGKEVVYDYAMKGKRVCSRWLVLSFTTASIFVGQHIFIELYAYIIDEWELLPMYPLTYPGPIEDHKQHPAVYTLLYLLLLYYLIYSANMYMGFVPLGSVFIIHVCGQLEILRKRALALYEDKSTPDVDSKLKEIVRHMQYIYRFVDYIREVFEWLYEFELKAANILVPITMYLVLESLKRGELNIDFINVIIGGLVITGEACYYSDKLMEKGEEVRLAIYSCGWETRYDQGVRKTLLMILLRTSHPIAIQTLFRTLCLDTFSDLLHQSYALFNIINAAWA